MAKIIAASDVDIDGGARCHPDYPDHTIGLIIHRGHKTPVLVLTTKETARDLAAMLRGVLEQDD